MPSKILHTRLTAVATEHTWVVRTEAGTTLATISNRIVDQEKYARLFAASDDMLALVKAVASASMGESRPLRGETFIGWQKGDGANADEVKTAARAILQKIEGRT